MAGASKRKAGKHLPRAAKVAKHGPYERHYPISLKSDGEHDVPLGSIQTNTANWCDTSSWASPFLGFQPAFYHLEDITSRIRHQPRRQPPRSQTKYLPRPLPESSDAPPNRAAKPEALVVSPFTHLGDYLPVSPYPRYYRPENGQVNGYVKFTWPSRAPSRRPSELPPLPLGDDVEGITANITRVHHPDRSCGVWTLPVTWYAHSIFPAPDGTISLSHIERGRASTSSQMLMTRLSVCSRDALPAVKTGELGMLPPQFGLEAKMNKIDRRLFEFYLKNWCPGRSVLNETNLWLKDLAPMHKNEGIRHALLSLAGIYIYDYVPVESIWRRTNELYVKADQYYSALLNAPESREVGKGQEAIAMAVILSMQDVVLTERRRKKSHKPPWLAGFKQAAGLLHSTDPGKRYWDNKNTELDSLRVSLSTVVGRGVILAQFMMPLTAPKTMNPEEELDKFRWLNYSSSEEDMEEIYGECGFSRTLLHSMSHVAYCAARLQQEPNTVVVPITAKLLLRELEDMRQWSREGKDWKTARNGRPTIEWVREVDGMKIDSSQIMTEVTAETWRIAAILYLQCRLLRLPRNHSHVLANLADLAKCIEIMPASGSHFTAQAPLLPVFLLGLLATTPEHKAIAKSWFEEVVSTPARSTVPPLYEALQRIWDWIDKEVPIQSEPTDNTKAINERVPWWETLVEKVRNKEKETLYLAS